MPQAGPPPIAQERSLTVVQANYETVVESFRGTEARAVTAMLGGDRQLRDRFLASAFAMLARNSTVLRDATPLSVVHAIKESARLGLEPMTEEAAIVVYDGIATLLPQWRGYVKRIRNSGQVTDIDCQLVYVNDDFNWRAGTDANINHVPALENRGDYWGVYAFAIMPSGRIIPEVMTVADINEIRDRFGNKRSRSGKPLPWETSWGEMARKTVIRRLAKRLPGAAVDHLLEVDARADRAAEAASAQISKLDEGLAEVRQMALAAVGALPATTEDVTEGDVTETKTDSTMQEETIAGELREMGVPEEEIQQGLADLRDDPGLDPNVQAAMALSEEQRRRGNR